MTAQKHATELSAQAPLLGSQHFLVTRLKSISLAVLMLILLSLDAVVRAQTLTLSRETSVTVSQTGTYRLRDGGHQHGWLPGTLSPTPYGDNYAYQNWTLEYDLSQIPSSGTLTKVTLTISRTDSVPKPIWGIVDWTFPYTGQITANVKDVSPEYAGWLVYMDSGGSRYWFPIPEPRDNTITIDLLSRGFGPQLLASKRFSITGVIQYYLGRVYLDEGNPERTDWSISGSASATIRGSLNVEYNAPPPTPTPTPTPSQMPPHNESIQPQSGDSPSGSVYTIRTTYADPNGVQDIANVVLRVGDSNSNALYAQYSAISRKFYLLNDAGTAYQSGVSPGSPSVISNSRGALDCSLSKVEVDGNQLVVTWAFVPSDSFVGTHNLYQLVRDQSGAQTDLERTGFWTVTTRPSINLAPSNVSLMPAAGYSRVGVTQFVKTTYADPNGVQDIANVVLRVGDSNSNALYAQYSAISRKFYLLNDAGTAYQDGFAPGSPNIITNSRGTLDCSLSKVETVGNQLVITWALAPSDSFAGAHNLYQLVRDRSNAQTDLELMGSWTIVR